MNDDDREMLFGMAEELAGYVVTDYDREDFQDSPTIDQHSQRVVTLAFRERALTK